MGWEDRISGAAYTSPSGDRLSFDYENVSKEIDIKGSAFEFPDVNGTYIQPGGHSGRRYPLRLFFWGDNYDQKVATFEKMLLQPGIGKLDHPVYGSVDVVPFGMIKRRDDLKTAANQAILELTFWETLDLIFPSIQNDGVAEILSAINAFNEEDDGKINIKTAVETASFKSSYQSFLKNAKGGLQEVADARADVQKQFEAVNKSINDGINILIAKPALLLFQTKTMIQIPARSSVSISARLEAYKNMGAALINEEEPLSKGNDSRHENKYATKDIFVTTATTGSIVSVVNNEFTTKVEAIEAAEEITNQLSAAVVWRDNNLKSLGIIDTGGSYQKLQKAAALTIGYLVQLSFNLKQERRIILDRDRTIIDLVAELYGSIDEQLDFFINSNNLTGSEIKEVPKGREIVYYL